MPEEILSVAHLGTPARHGDRRPRNFSRTVLDSCLEGIRPRLALPRSRSSLRFPALLESEGARRIAQEDPDMLRCWSRLGNEIQIVKVYETLTESPSRHVSRRDSPSAVPRMLGARHEPRFKMYHLSCDLHPANSQRNRRSPSPRISPHAQTSQRRRFCPHPRRRSNAQAPLLARAGRNFRERLHRAPLRSAVPPIADRSARQAPASRPRPRRPEERRRRR